MSNEITFNGIKERVINYLDSHGPVMVPSSYQPSESLREFSDNVSSEIGMPENKTHIVVLAMLYSERILKKYQPNEQPDMLGFDLTDEFKESLKKKGN